MKTSISRKVSHEKMKLKGKALDSRDPYLPASKPAPAMAGAIPRVSQMRKE